MMDQDSLQKYKAIHAPDSLKEKVLSYQAKSVSRTSTVKLKSYVKPLTAFAACIFLAFLFSFPASRDQADILIGGETVGTKPYEITALRRATFMLGSPVWVQLEVSCGKPVRIVVDSGVVRIYGENHAVIGDGTSGTAESGQSVEWIIGDADTDSRYHLSLKGDDTVRRYELLFSEKSGTWSIRLMSKGESS